ncbi:hypothetical protein TMatcc_005897 [Talaromyces marneffei ATCC 18224]
MAIDPSRFGRKNESIQMFDSLLESGPSQLHLEHLFFVASLSFLLHSVFLHLNVVFCLGFALRFQLSTQSLDFHSISFQQHSTSAITISSIRLFCSFGMTDNIVLCSGSELQSVECFIRVRVGRGSAAGCAYLNKLRLVHLLGPRQTACLGSNYHWVLAHDSQPQFGQQHDFENSELSMWGFANI